MQCDGQPKLTVHSRPCQDCPEIGQHGGCGKNANWEVSPILHGRLPAILWPARVHIWWIPSLRAKGGKILYYFNNFFDLKSSLVIELPKGVLPAGRCLWAIQEKPSLHVDNDWILGQPFFRQHGLVIDPTQNKIAFPKCNKWNDQANLWFLSLICFFCVLWNLSNF